MTVTTHSSRGAKAPSRGAAPRRPRLLVNAVGVVAVTLRNASEKAAVLTKPQPVPEVTIAAS